MCKIRIVIERDSAIIQDNIMDIATALGVVERPTYIERKSSNGIKEIIFHYSGSTEKYISTQYDEIIVEYGIVSGRIKRVETKRNELFETDIYNLQQIVVTENSSSLRFSSNFKEGLILACKILKMK